MRVRSILVAAILLLGCTTVTSCSHAICDPAPTAATFVGRLATVRDDTATFAVETVATPDRTDAAPVGVVPLAGKSVAVRYSDDEQRFLRVGRRYAVMVWLDEATFVSGVHHSDDPCSTGTTYADGSAINTSLWSRPIVRRVGTGFVLLVVLALATLAWFTRRIHRRKRAPIE
jgi:hypothetical protein